MLAMRKAGEQPDRDRLLTQLTKSILSGPTTMSTPWPPTPAIRTGTSAIPMAARCKRVRPSLSTTRVVAAARNSGSRLAAPIG